MSIQWFPGHMTRTKKLITENLKKVDMVVEILDARAPLASRNPLLDELTRGKPRLILLNKADLADPEVTKRWMTWLTKGADVRAVAVNSKNKKSLKAVPGECKRLCTGKKWVNRRPVRTMVVGIPNVGKSTVINTLTGRKKAKAGNQPGVTRDMQHVNVSRELQVLDTPGILWHKFDDPVVGLKLAVLGSIKDAILHIDEIAMGAVRYVKGTYPAALARRFKLKGEDGEMTAAELDKKEPHEILEELGRNRGLLIPGGEVDRERASRLLLKELRDGLIAKISLEGPEDPAAGWPAPEEPAGEDLTREER